MDPFTHHKVRTKRLDRLTIGVVLQSPEGQWRLGRIEQREKVIYYYLSGPGGFHITYHDADARHATGRIHVRLGRNSGGRIVEYPGAKDIGIEAASWEAPTFRQLGGVLHLSPLPPLNAPGPFFSVAILQNERRPGSHRVDHVLAINQRALASKWVWLALLAMEPDNNAALETWLKERLWPGFSLHSVDIFSNYQPWLSCVVGSTPEPA